MGPVERGSGHENHAQDGCRYAHNRKVDQDLGDCCLVLLEHSILPCFQTFMLHHMNASPKSDPLAWVRGRVDVMIDLVRHEFMGPGHTTIISGRPQSPQTPNSRTGRMYAAQNTHSEDMGRPGQLPTKVCPQSGVLPCSSPGASLALSRHAQVLFREDRVLRREVKLSVLCPRAIGTERYLVLAGNTNRPQLNLPSCGLACMLACFQKWIPDLDPAAIAIGSIVLDC